MRWASLVRVRLVLAGHTTLVGACFVPSRLGSLVSTRLVRAASGILLHGVPWPVMVRQLRCGIVNIGGASQDGFRFASSVRLRFNGRVVAGPPKISPDKACPVRAVMVRTVGLDQLARA